MMATSGAFLINWTGCTDSAIVHERIEEFYKGFENPPVDAKVFVRWWWNGNRLDEQEILRELDVMQEAGIGGVEINPIAFPGNADPAGYEALTMFEDKWLDMLAVALEGAKARGMVCDMIVGSGWPFGGEFLKKEDQSQMVTIGTLNLQGGKKYSFRKEELLDKVNLHLHSKNEDLYKELLMVRLAPAVSDTFTEGKDLTQQISNDQLNLEVPPGEHILYYVVKFTGYMAVINGAPGAAGPVLNHYSQPAVENYLNRISASITSRIGNMGQYIRAMFCDSMELEGANWNDDLPEEFEKRRGYDLWPYLPFVLKKTGHMGNPLDEDYGTRFPEQVNSLIQRVGLDYYETRLELFRERFIEPFNAWCHQNNVFSRAQAYGRGYHPLEASMEIDIPECETWLNRAVGREYPDTGLTGRAHTMVNKYVASGAALAGRKKVSCEEITNTSMVFMATLENIKIAGDQSNISGVNHSILHGFNYSPPDVPFPGWIRYGTWFNERNTWWPWFKSWSVYKARISYLLQNASPQANIAILQPLNDLWIKKGPQRDPFPQAWYPEYQNNLWEAIHQNGGGCDYVSEKIIQNASFKNGKMMYGERAWHTLLMPEIETLSMETAQSLQNFVAEGGKIVFIEKVPSKSPSYLQKEEHDKAVEEIMTSLLNDARENVNLVPAPKNDPIPWFEKIQGQLQLNPYVKFSHPQKFLSQSCYKLAGNWLFFIANTSLEEDISVTAEFMVDDAFYPWLWDAETGKRWLLQTGDKPNTLQLELPGATSRLIVFEKNREGEPLSLPALTTRGNELSGPWELQLNQINGYRYDLHLESLTDLIELEETKHFAGTVTYEKTFDPGAEDIQSIDLGQVYGITELTLNGKSLGNRWYGRHLYDIRDAVQKGENKLSVKLTTITGNYMKNLKDNAVAQRWTRNQPYYSMGIIGPVRIF